MTTYTVRNRNQKTTSGLAFTEVKRMARAGELDPNDEIREDGRLVWHRASTMEGLEFGPTIEPDAGEMDVVDSPEPREEVIPDAPPDSPVLYAGFLKRVAAIVIDYVVNLIFWFVVGFMLGFSNFFHGWGYDEVELFFNCSGIITGWIYFAGMESSGIQGTVGKLALGIKVTDLAGRRIGFGQATGRHFGKLISAIILCIGFLMVGFTSKKQGLHDMMAGCLVINKY